jgi:hypothetical protein
MHPAMAWWMWSMAMTRVCHDPLGDFGGLPDTQNPVTGIQRRNRPLADSGRDRLADLHWMESEPGLAA